MSLFDEKNLCMGYVRTDTGVYINTYRGRITGWVWWYRSGKRECRDTREETDRSGRRR